MVVAKVSESGCTPFADRNASRPASTPMVVVSSSYDATDRVPLPPALAMTSPIAARWSR